MNIVWRYHGKKFGVQLAMVGAYTHVVGQLYQTLGVVAIQSVELFQKGQTGAFARHFINSVHDA